MSAFRRDIDGVLGAVDAVNKGRSVELNIVAFHHLLQVDFSYDFTILYIPVDQFGVESPSQTEMFLLSLQKRDGVDDVEVALVEQLHALKIVIIQPSIALIVPSSQNIMTGLNPNHRQFIKMRLLVLPPNLLHKHSFLPRVETIHKLPRTNKEQVLAIVIAVGEAFEGIAAEEFD